MKLGLATLLCGLAATAASANCAETEPQFFAASSRADADCASEANTCRWTFDLGDADSRTLFADLRKTIAACPDQTDMVQDKGVNHPDFYDAWIFRIGDQALSLSLKDKSALKQTFVVLRVLHSP